MTRSLTGDWTLDLPHSEPALGYRGGGVCYSEKISLLKLLLYSTKLFLTFKIKCNTSIYSIFIFNQLSVYFFIAQPLITIVWIHATKLSRFFYWFPKMQHNFNSDMKCITSCVGVCEQQNTSSNLLWFSTLLLLFTNNLQISSLTSQSLTNHENTAQQCSQTTSN